MTTRDPPHPPHLAGSAALGRGAWAEARAIFDAAVASDPTDPSAWEGRAAASLWLQDAEGTVESHEHAYTLHRERGDDLAAARACLELAGAFLELRGEPAIANGWFQRARRLLCDLPPAREHALLHIWDAFFALEVELDTAAGMSHARRAIEISEAAEAPDTAVLGLALEGLSRVISGEVREGMSLLDEAVATAVSGELSDPDFICRTCCCMIDACDQVRDYGRAVEWCDRLRTVAERWQVQSFITTCRIKYSGVLLWRGDWEGAEAELDAALRESGDAAPATALVRLAELRRRQGRTEEAVALLDDAGMHPAVVRVRAAMALEADDPVGALDLIDDLLRRIPHRVRTERVGALELRLAAEASLGRADDAQKTLIEIDRIASEIGTDPIQATALWAHGAVAMLREDHAEARRCYEEAAHLFERSGSPYECARARLELAGALAAAGRDDRAAAQAAAALEVLEQMGAAPDTERARTLLASTEPQGDRKESPLTPRQREVLSLVAEGLTDREIGERLFISEFTVHRHVSDILTRLGASSRTGAVARTLREGLL
jgi:DNA-binding NarL/FixJ family response regulator